MNPNFQLFVDCYKINTWLQQRKKMPKDWQICLKACDAKIRTLLQDPTLKQQKPIFQQIKTHKQNFTYPYILSTCDKLQKSKLSSQKNFIGQYTNQTLKNWLALKKYMKKDLTGLLHATRVINQILKFDLPGLKKSKEIFRNQIQVCKRKIDSNNNAVYQNKIGFEGECKRYGIKGENVRAEVPRLVEELPEWFEKVEKGVGAEMEAVVGLYQSVCEINGVEPSALKLLKYFSKKGDDLVSIYNQTEPTENIGELRSKKYDIFKESSNNQWEIQISGQQSSSKPQHQTILSHRSTRLQLINNLSQLLSFYQVFQTQLKSGDTHLLSPQYLKIHPSQQQLTSYITLLTTILANLNNSHFNELLSLYQHEQASHRICHKLELYPTTTKRYIEENEKLVARIQEIEEKISEAEKEICVLKGEVVECQKVIEEELSVLMKREVKLVGDINKVEMQY